jgi:hypothetical protein
MEKIGRPRLLKGESPAETLLKLPIIRGWAGDPKPQDWMTAGCGRKLVAVEKQKAEVKASSESDIEREWTKWGEVLTEEFVAYVRSTKFLLFVCPHCSAHI